MNYNNNDPKQHVQKKKSNLLLITSLIFIIFVNILFELSQLVFSIPFQLQILLTYIQIIILLLTTYKFLLKGLLITILFNSVSGIHLYIKFVTENDTLFIEMTFYRLFSILLSWIIYYLSMRQRGYIDHLENNVLIDSISGVYNHRYFQERLEQEIKQAKQSNNKLGMIMLDIDNFRKFNDEFGHNDGDILLKLTAEVIQQTVRNVDIISRYGGDEFAILLPFITDEKLRSISDELRTNFESMIVKSLNNENKNIVESVSIGYSIFPDLALTSSELISQTDSALYTAKQTGRNNVKIYKDAFNSIKDYLNHTETQLLTSLKTLLGTVSAKDRYTLGHSERVMEYVVSIGEAMNLNEEDLKVLKISALLHDIGKIEIPQEILNKKDKLTDEEFDLIRMHPVYSAEIIKPLSSLVKLHDIVKHHHERIDGNGYPDRIKGDAIPLEARILSVADSFDAMMSDRPYRKPFSVKEAICELKRCSGKQFDPVITDIFINILEIDGGSELNESLL